MIRIDAQTKSNIAAMLKEHGVLSAYLFGSYVRNTQNPESDIDIMVQLEPSYTLFDVLGIRLDLEDSLGIKVDLIPEDSIIPELEGNIMQKRVRLF